MKKLFILSLITIFSNYFAFADEGKVSFGIEVTPAITWLNTTHNKVNPDGSAFKLNGGMNINFNLGESYSIVTGLRYNTFGGDLFAPNIETNKIRYEFNEIEIPIGLKLRTGSFGKFRIAAHMGIGLGIDIKAKETINGVTNHKDQSVATNTNFNLMPIRALHNLGIGVEYDLDEVILVGKIGYKGWFSNLYFYENKMFDPINQLQLITASDLPVPSTYTNPITFQPSAVELTIGVIF